MRRRIEITTIERERVVRFSGQLICPWCETTSEFLTVAQAAALAQVKPDSVRRWLANNLATALKPAADATASAKTRFS